MQRCTPRKLVRRPDTVRRVHATRAAFRAWRSYRGTGLLVELFLAARLLVLPRKALAKEFRRLHGEVLGVGSGHGLLARWLAELNPDVRVTGIDIDEERVSIARETEARSPRVRILVEDVRSLDPATTYDAAAAIDLMHHIPHEDHAQVADALARAVRSGGELLIKDVAPTPRWKHGVNRIHDRVVAGERTEACDPAQLAELFTRAGFETEAIYRTGRLNPYPHFILRARRQP